MKDMNNDLIIMTTTDKGVQNEIFPLESLCTAVKSLQSKSDRDRSDSEASVKENSGEFEIIHFIQVTLSAVLRTVESFSQTSPAYRHIFFFFLNEDQISCVTLEYGFTAWPVILL